MQDSAVEPATAFVDLGYRGVDAQNPDVRIVHRGKTQRISGQERLLRRAEAGAKSLRPGLMHSQVGLG
jgi:IS5 family transposase